MAIQHGRWGEGQLIAFSGLDGPTDSSQGLVLRTLPRPAGLEIVLPVRGGRICLLDDPLDSARIASDWIQVTAGGRSAALAMADTYSVAVRGADRIEAPEGIETHHRDGLTLLSVPGKTGPEMMNIDFEAILKARQSWSPKAVSSAIGEGPMAKALTQMKGQIYSPEGRLRRRWSTPDRWPHRRMWLWDSVFHAAGWRHLDPDLALELTEAVLDGQEPDGFIPHLIDPYSSSTITQPPLLGLGARLVLEGNPDLARAAALYPRLRAYLSWDEAHRDVDGDGLLEWMIQEDGHCRSGESGMDNSPRFDSALSIGAVDFTAYTAQEHENLAFLADMCGRSREAAEHRGSARRYVDLLLDRCWDSSSGFFRDCMPDGSFSPVEAVTGFLPLIAGEMPPDVLEGLERALDDPRRFGAPLPVPSVSLSDPAWGTDMWRGPVWINMNWLICRGLERNGLSDRAAELRRRTVGLLERGYERFGTFFEYYDAADRIPPPLLPRKGRNDPARSPYHQVLFDYGWSATLYVDMKLKC